MSGVRFEVAGSVGRIVLDRPGASNAFDVPAAEAFGDAVARAAAADVDAVLVVGEGPRFCAGGDVRSFADAADPGAHVRELASVLGEHFHRLSELEVPVVAGVHGAVAGAGLALVLACDVVVAGASTKFVAAYTGVGLTPDCGLSFLLPRAVGSHRALDFALSGRVLSAAEAESWGLIARVVADGQVAAEAGRLAAAMAGGPTYALGETKRLLRRSWEGDRGTAAVDEVATIARAVMTDEATRAIARFAGS
jgi:2-(1,2-epoxy-1,2-dihydrophenyl)acetyl-CoA isomerase